MLYATRAPDFGRIQLLVDGEPGGDPVDLYAPVVVPTGAIPLGELSLQPGDQLLTMRVVGRNAASSGYAFAIDALDRSPTDGAAR